VQVYRGVVTTGIYCREGCGARPLPRHVRTFATAASAEAAGFRACLQCRPYRQSPEVSWVGPELVCRGVQLVLDGILQDANEDALARRLGVSARHLRRAFLAHVGVTPSQLARSGRAHFARRLLDDTDLTITEVAFAAGFGSVRQFGRVMVEVFRATPSELRARRRVGDRLAADGGIELRLPFRPPLDFEGMLGFLRTDAIAGVEHVADGHYRRTISVEGDPGVIEVRRGGHDHLVLRAHLPHWRGLLHVAQRARHIFDLDIAHADAECHHADDPVLGPLVRRRPGLRMIGSWDAVETGVLAIVSQQAGLAGATVLLGRVADRFGTPVAGLRPLGLRHLFPPVEALCEADVAETGIDEARSAAVAAFARAVRAGQLHLDRSMPLDDLLRGLTALPGVGEWAAQFLALRLGEPDAFPVNDPVLARVFEAACAGAGRDAPSPPAPSLAEHAERWRPWRALAATQLWVAQSELAARAAG
jgi:AraC family transcriptional regulator of adaptative response / DNA-3-methyladenine glycosylase II